MPSIILKLSRVLTWIGSSILVIVSVVSFISIFGRTFSSFGLSSIRGDYEIVELGVTIAVFSFMPWCYVKGGHASVDLLWGSLPSFVKKMILVFNDSLMLMVWSVMGWQMTLKMQEYYSYQEVSFLLKIPLWVGYAVNIPLVVIGCIVYLFVLLNRLGIRSGNDLQSLGR